MYIRKVEIKNIRSIDSFAMDFPAGQEAGWHVLLGANGSGKSTIVRSIALALLGPKDGMALRADWEEWLQNEKHEGSIELQITQDVLDQSMQPTIPIEGTITNLVRLLGYASASGSSRNVKVFFGKENGSSYSEDWNWGENIGWFSTAYGPFRRFSGGNQEKEGLYRSYPRLGAHLSVFGEDVALSETLVFLRELYFEELEASSGGANVNNGWKSTLQTIINFVNRSRMLPHGAMIHNVNKDGVWFRDGNQQLVRVLQMSDGFRSFLSLTFELIRQLIRVYGITMVRNSIDAERSTISLPGVVLIDEVDAHLHPSWQTEIGVWFTKYFPKLQFIVTTHSPLVCRAAVNGSIWRLSTPGTDQESGRISELQRKRLVYGDILEAYDTDLFGESASSSANSQEMQQRLAQLNKRSIMGEITADERNEMMELRSFLSLK